MPATPSSYGFYVRNPARRKAADLFPWLAHRTLAEVIETEQLERLAEEGTLAPAQRTRLVHLRRRAVR